MLKKNKNFEIFAILSSKSIYKFTLSIPVFSAVKKKLKFNLKIKIKFGLGIDWDLRKNLYLLPCLVRTLVLIFNRSTQKLY